jgi:hypothetical protein
MARRRKRPSHEYHHTPITLLVAFFGGACAFIAVEIFLPDLLELCEPQIGKFPGWQIHMGATCIEVMTFFVFLFFLELLETRSRLTAWRASAPWLPLVGLTFLATIIHIPYYVVMLAGTIYGAWAYRQTSSVRCSHRLRGPKAYL